jgi:hypothetical protein
MKADGIDMVEVVDHRADRPASKDWGGRSVPRADDTGGFVAVGSDAEPIYSTKEAAQFFDRSNQWLYWGLRNGVFTHEDGTPIELDREGDATKGRRRFTLPIIEAIMMSSYRRGNMSHDELKKIMLRIEFTRKGVEWREREGWKYVHLGRNRHRWAHPAEVVRKSGEWRLKPEARR